MKKLFAALVVFAMILSLTACGGSPKLHEVAGGVITASIPSDWCFVSGTDMNGAAGSDYICHTDKFEIGDPYLQVMHEMQNRSIEDLNELFESETVYGKYIGSFTLGETTWYTAEAACAGIIDDKVCLVLSYECDFENSEVQAILGSLRWAT